MLTLHESNRVEALADALFDRLKSDPPPVFETHEILVPSAAIQCYLSLAIADRAGVCANVRFAFLAQWLWRQIAESVPGVGAESPFDPAVMGWRIDRLWRDAELLEGHERLAGYLRGADPLMRHELAMATAALFEQYVTYRPDWLAAWSAVRPAEPGGALAAHAEDERWQAALWRRLAAELGAGGVHPAQRFLEAVDAGRARLPARLHVYALPTLAPLYLELLARLADRIDVHVYALDACREYWFEVVGPRRLARLGLRGEADYHEVGHPLLASWGRQSQAQLGLLHGVEPLRTEGRFVANGGATLLARLQDALLDMAPAAPASIALAPDDRSIEVHVAHSLLREVEVLHDRLLALFAEPDAPRPCDIAVVMPDLEAAAPLIDAVFGTAPAARRIPYAISGRRTSTHNAAARALLGVLALVDSRWPASAVAELLQQPLVARRFGVADHASLASVDRWLRRAGVRWGRDAAHRERLGLPATSRHSFDDGLQRLFLGYALPGEVEEPFDGLLPTGDAEGSAAFALGALWRFVRALGELQAALAAPLAPDAWLARLEATIDAFLAPAEGGGDDALREQCELRELRAAVRKLHADLREGDAEAVPLDVLRAALAKRLDEGARGAVPTGAVTFSTIAGLRNVPFRVVCAIQLNDGLYPATARPPEFDLMAARPRAADRQRRDDDRQAFLDLLLAARDRVHLSYTGRSARDNSAMPPSVLVAELLDALVPAIADAPTPEALRRARERLVVVHPLQPFSPAAFDTAGDPRLRSHDAESAEALRRAAEAAAPPAAPGSGELHEEDDAEADADEADDALGTEPPFFAAPLADPGPEWRETSVERLVEFFRNPSRYLLRRRLGIDLRAVDEALADDEPLIADFPSRAALGDRLLPHALAGRSAADLRALALAGTEMPGGRLGERLLEREIADLQRFAATLADALAVPTLPPAAATLDFDLDGESWRVAGAYADLRAGGLVRWRCDDVRPIDYLAGWIAHLWLCAARPAGAKAETHWHSRNGVYRLEALGAAEAREALGRLLELYRRGLREPLRFYPKSAWAYALRGARAARQCWLSTPDRPHGEAKNPAYRLALRGVADPLAGDFERCAQAVYAPLLAALDDPRVVAIAAPPPWRPRSR